MHKFLSFVLILIIIKGEVGTVKLIFKPDRNILTGRFKVVFFCGCFYYLCLSVPSVMSVSCQLVVGLISCLTFV